MTDAVILKRLRRQALAGAFGSQTTLAGLFARVAFVQADPIRAPARAQDLILRHRVAGYRAGDLERRYPRLDLEEAYLHAYGFMTPSVHALLLPRYDPAFPDGRHEPSGLAAEVLEFVAARGPTHPGALTERFGREREVNGWGGMSKATTRALQALLHHGRLRVVGRAGGVRVYQAVPMTDALHSGARRVEQLTLLVARLLAPVPAQTLSATMAPIVRRVLGPGVRSTALSDLLEIGTLRAEAIDGVRYVSPIDLSEGGPVRQQVRFLAPFDPLVWDRRRFEHLWGWPYRFEAYTPPSQRKMGYYAMPLLWGDAVIGWVNCARGAGRLDVQAGFVEGRPRGAAFRAAFDAEVARMERFLSAEVVDSAQESASF